MNASSSALDVPMSVRSDAVSGIRWGPVLDGMSVAAQGRPSMVPSTFTGRRVAKSFAKPGTLS